MSHDENSLKIAFGEGASANAIPVSTIMDMGMHYGKGYLRDNEKRFFSNVFSPIEQMRPHFLINDKYILRKLFILLFPFRSNFARKTADEVLQGQEDSEELPVKDAMAPDLYIPIVSLITLGLFRSFRSISKTSCPPEAMLANFTVYCLFWVIQMLITKLSMIISSIPISVSWLDIASWMGYIHVQLISTALVDVALHDEWKVASVFATYFGIAWIYFLYRTLENTFCYTKRSAIALYVVCGIQVIIFCWLRARFFVV